jgi:RNA polymerase sigma-70 factor, ECF subfamily
MVAQIALPNVSTLLDFSNRWPGGASGPAVIKRDAPPVSTPPREWASDAAWIADVRTGDEAAATALVQRLSPLVLKCVRSHRPRRTAEEDMVQAVFMKIFSKLDQFSGQVPLEHWVSRITVNTCIKQLDYESVRPELRMSDLREEEEAVVQQLAAAPDELPGDYALGARELVAKLLTLLSAADRTVVTLLHLESRSTEEVSRLTGWSVPVVKVRAFRARNKMRRALKTLLSRNSVPMESLGWFPA